MKVKVTNTFPAEMGEIGLMDFKGAARHRVGFCGLDTSQLPDWPPTPDPACRGHDLSLNRYFESALSFEEFRGCSNKPPTAEQLVQQAFITVARCWEDKGNSPCPVLMVTDGSQDALILHITRVSYAIEDERGAIPVIELRYQLQTGLTETAKEELAKETLRELLSGLDPSQLSDWPLSVTQEVNQLTMVSRTGDSPLNLMQAILDANQSRIWPLPGEGCLSDDTPKEAWLRTIIFPLVKSSQYNASSNSHCVCGKQGTHTCARCKIQSYCCRECQKTHWKAHKLECVSPEADVSAAADMFSVCLKMAEYDAAERVDDLAKDGFEAGGSISFVAPMMGPRTSTKPPSKDVLRVYKLQVSLRLSEMLPERQAAAIAHVKHHYGEMYPGVSAEKLEKAMRAGEEEQMEQGLIKCEDERRKVRIQISRNSCRRHAELKELIRIKGLNGGTKLYVNGYITADDKLHLLCHKCLPSQPW